MIGFKRTSFSLTLCIITLYHIILLRHDTGESVGWFLTFTAILLVFVVGYLYADLKEILRDKRRRK
jgi:hypothetical protein